ncbi:tRNA (adenosine(37)-N6)-dimethylallyltransferase MiaA [Candidatus Microgenomates bacterium]|nr:tRNA (adenosine(37)-N6)-dimethylallyltransferase MiaA [Candidatus Microgenomates bacterium]
MKKLLVILGPTSTGKTDLALILAKKFDGELVSCDSRQVYVGLDIGTGKLPSGRWKLEDGNWKKGQGFWEIGGIRVWMHDVISPKKQYTVFDYVKDANRVIGEIRERGKLPIVVGGTGLYLKALLEGLPALAIPPNLKLRKELEKLPLSQLQARLQKLSPQRWKKMNDSDRQNPRRLVRAIELASAEFISEESLRATIRGGLNTLKIGLTASRRILYQGSDERVVKRLNQGMVEEAKRLYKGGLSLKRMRQLGLEYGVLADYLDGKIRVIEGDQGLIEIMQNKIHGYIRRQLTWFKKEKNVYWFDILDKQSFPFSDEKRKNFPDNVAKMVAGWYHQADDTKN